MCVNYVRQLEACLVFSVYFNYYHDRKGVYFGEENVHTRKKTFKTKTIGATRDGKKYKNGRLFIECPRKVNARCHVRMLLPPPLGKVALVALLSPEWGCEGASSMEQQTALNAAWVAEADAVLLEHYASFFDSPR